MADNNEKQIPNTVDEILGRGDDNNWPQLQRDRDWERLAVAKEKGETESLCIDMLKSDMEMLRDWLGVTGKSESLEDYVTGLVMEAVYDIPPEDFDSQ